MGINEISGSGMMLQPSQPKKTQNEKTTDSLKKDRAEFSAEAKDMYSSTQAKHIEEIRQRVESGFYNSPDVMAKVVDSIIKEVQ